MHRITVYGIAGGRTDVVRCQNGVTVAIHVQVLFTVLAQSVHVVHVVHVIISNNVLVATPQTVADHDSGRPVEAILQVVAHHPEIRQAHPARLDGA